VPGVLRIDDGRGDGPRYGERWIVPQQRALVLGIPEVGGLVEELRFVRHDDEPVREAGRNPQHALVRGGQRDAGRAAEIRGAAPQVDGHVEHFALRRAHELALGVLDLVMQPAQDAVPRARVVVLYERRVDARLRERAGVPALEEKAAVVAPDLRLDQPDVGNRGRRDVHLKRMGGSDNSAIRYCP
jgi:hypothetical protein